MSRRLSRNHNGEQNISVYVLISIVGVVVISCILAYSIYSNKVLKQGEATIGNTKRDTALSSEMMNMVTNNTNSQAVSSSIGKSVNEVSASNNQISNSEVNKVAVNTSNEEKKKESTNSTSIANSINNESANNSKNSSGTVKDEISKDPTFVKPVEGEVLKNYSKDNLVYSTTLDEWTTHLGIDYAATKTDVVKAAADGKIKSIKNDPRYGLTIVIEHTNGFESIYSSLLTSEFVTVGEAVKQGQTIATVGNTATFEIADETHLHFEIKVNGEDVDPNIYLK